MEMNQIEAFVTIAQIQGFSRAATMLHLSQPAISRRISLLERELGITLFERVHGGALLTEAGQVFLPYARQVLAAASDGIEAIKALDQQEQGTIKLAIVGTLASTNLTTRLLQFRKAYPQVRLLLRTARSNEVSEMIQSGEVHLGLRYFADPNPQIVSQLVEEEPLVVACSAQHSFTDGLPSEASQLTGIPWVSFPIGAGAPGSFARVLEQQLTISGLRDVEFITIDSLTAQKRLIEADFGLGLLPISSIQEELHLGTLQILDIPTLQTTMPVMAAYRQQGYLSKATRSLLEKIVKPL